MNQVHNPTRHQHVYAVRVSGVWCERGTRESPAREPSVETAPRRESKSRGRGTLDQVKMGTKVSPQGEDPLLSTHRTACACGKCALLFICVRAHPRGPLVSLSGYAA